MLRSKQEANRIAISLGDPAGIGPDVAIKSCLENSKDCRVYFTDPSLIAQRSTELGIPIRISEITDFDQASSLRPSTMQIYPIVNPNLVTTGKSDPNNTEHILECLNSALWHTTTGIADALVTGPINKAVINNGGVDFTGHTEYLAEALGVKIITGTEVTGFKRGSNSKAVTGVVTSKGTIECEQVVIGAGPWVKSFWDKLELPNKISIKDQKGVTHKNYPMWIYWFLTEGVLGVDPNFQKTDDGKMPPVIHVDSDAHLFSDVDGSLITDKMWGIYYKPDFNFNGVQGGAAPYKVNKPAENVKVDPYGIDSPEYQTTDEFAHMWCSALAHCQKRFKGKIKVYHKGPSGGLGCFTPDSFPVFDRFCENVYFIADSNHGYKMIGVGELVADELLGKERDLLKPFRFNRYEKGELHPTSSSPFPWS